MALIIPGQLVLFRFPQTDLATGKIRPALIITRLPSDYSDWLVCMISSRTEQTISGIDDVISPSDDDFADSGLRTESIVRVTRLAVVSDDIFLGLIGSISAAHLARLRSRLADWIVTG